MARQGFKRGGRGSSQPAERSVYVLAASIVLMILFRFWRPIDADRLERDEPARRQPHLGCCSGIGWLIVLISTFLINHFELFGLQQAWFHLRGRDAEPPEFRQPFFYK